MCGCSDLFCLVFFLGGGVFFLVSVRSILKKGRVKGSLCSSGLGVAC